MTFFKDLKQNYFVYIFDKQNITFTQGKITDISSPHIDMRAPMINSSYQTVVDITVEVNSKTNTYTIPDNLSFARSGSLVIATEKEDIIKEIEVIKMNAEHIVNTINDQKAIIEKTSKLLETINPVFKQEKERENRFTAIENSIKKINEQQKAQNEMISKFIAEFKS